MKETNTLIIFSKNLMPGKVKTRLAASIGSDQAFEIYRALLYHIKFIVQEVNVHKVVYYSDQVVYEDMWDDRFSKAIQEGEDLGARMMNAFKDMLQEGYRKVVIIGTDCPFLNKQIIYSAFESLDQNDVVIGPAYDGGYYLLGMKTLHQQLFQNISWSTGRVFEETITNCHYNALNYSVLPALHDIDEEKDLVHLKDAGIYSI